VENKPDLIKEYGIMKSEGYSTERALDKLVSDHKMLLRGSVMDVSDGFLRPTDRNDTRLYATSMASIAILNAVFSKDGNPKFEYPFYIDDDHPLKLKIHGINEDTVRGSGFVYIIAERSGFLRIPIGSWQYVKYSVEVPYHSKIKVLREDFEYPVYDVDNGRMVR